MKKKVAIFSPADRGSDNTLLQSFMDYEWIHVEKADLENRQDHFIQPLPLFIFADEKEDAVATIDINRDAWPYIVEISSAPRPSKSINVFHFSPNAAQTDLAFAIEMIEKLIEKDDDLHDARRLAPRVAHEIATPVSLLAHHMKALDEKWKKAKGAKSPEVSESILDLFKSLEKLDSSIGNMTSLDFGKPTHVKSISCDELNSVIEDCIKDFRDLQEIKPDISYEKFKNPSELTVSFDKSHLQQIIRNLIKNSIEASPQKTEIDMSWHVLDEGFIALHLCDNGPGISKENSKRVFRSSFTTKDSSTPRGMGLAISKKLANKNNGDLLLINDNEKTIFAIVMALK